MSKEPFNSHPNELAAVDKSPTNELADVEAYIIGLPESIPKIEADFLESFMANIKKVIAGSFGQTYISKDGSSVMKKINLNNRYKMLLKYPNSEINSIIIGELKSEIEYYHDISSLCDNVCKFLGYYYDTSSKTIYINMENCGTDLFDIYAQNTIPSLEQNIYFIKQIVNALHCLHANGYAHRDLKPENITVTAKGKILLIDFGFLAHAEKKNIAGKGSLLYMSPENRVPGELSFEQLKAYDIYSLGVIILFMILPSDYKNILFKNIISKNPKLVDFNNSNFTNRIWLLETHDTRFEDKRIQRICNKKLYDIFGKSIGMHSFFTGIITERSSTEKLKHLLESSAIESSKNAKSSSVESSAKESSAKESSAKESSAKESSAQRSDSRGGSKSRKKKRGARRRRRTRRINKNKRN